MGITIDTAILRVKHSSMSVDDKETADCIINTMRKYQKIEEIVNGWNRYRKGVSSSEGDSVYMQKVSEVVKDG